MVALGGATREALRMVDVLKSMRQGLRGALQRPDPRHLSELKRLDDVVANGSAGRVAKQLKRGLLFAPAKGEPLRWILDRLISNLRSAAAYPVLEGRGELLPSRLR